MIIIVGVVLLIDVSVWVKIILNPLIQIIILASYIFCYYSSPRHYSRLVAKKLLSSHLAVGVRKSIS